MKKGLKVRLLVAMIILALALAPITAFAYGEEMLKLSDDIKIGPSPEVVYYKTSVDASDNTVYSAGSADDYNIKVDYTDSAHLKLYLNEAQIKEGTPFVLPSKTYGDLKVTIITEKDSSIANVICNSTGIIDFEGPGTLTVLDGMNESSGLGVFTFKEGSNVVVKGFSSIGASGGVDSRIVVEGNATFEGSLITGLVKIGPKGVLTVKDTLYVRGSSGGNHDNSFVIENGGTFVTDCEDNITALSITVYKHGTEDLNKIVVIPEGYIPDGFDFSDVESEYYWGASVHKEDEVMALDGEYVQNGANKYALKAKEVDSPQPPTKPPTQTPTQPPAQPPTQTPTQPPAQPPTQTPTQPPAQPPTQTPTQPPAQTPAQIPAQAPVQESPKVPATGDNTSLLAYVVLIAAAVATTNKLKRNENK